MFFIQTAFDPATRFRFAAVLLTVVVSIVLHELAHGWAAIWQGDDTPIREGHMTANPLVHMGGFSILLLLTAGFAYGMMPVNPNRFRSRHGDACVSAAGPAMNLLLALAALTGLALWIRAAGMGDELPLVHANLQRFLWYFGYTNLGLMILNLLPIPPLDGSAILGSFHRGYARWLTQFHDPRVFMGALLVILVVGSYTDFGLWGLASRTGLRYLNLVSGHDLVLTN